MRGNVSRITVKGQVTIPGAIRKALKLSHGDKVIFDFQDGKVTLRPLKRTSLVELRGSLQSSVPFPGDEVIEERMKAHVAREALGPVEEDRR